MQTYVDQNLNNAPHASLLPEDKSEKIIQLKKNIRRLKRLCMNLDPYKSIPEKIKRELRSFHIIELDDPFRLTNQLIVLLEDAQEELLKLETSDE